MSTAPREYTATITYRPGDEPTREVASCPQVFNGGFTTEDAREQYIAKTCHDFTHQPTAPQYEIVSVERGDRCGRCSGVGTIKVRPKGWRKASAPPWYMMREKPCPQCAPTTG